MDRGTLQVSCPVPGRYENRLRMCSASSCNTHTQTLNDLLLAGITVTWKSAVSGDWSDSTKWSPRYGVCSWFFCFSSPIYLYSFSCPLLLFRSIHEWHHVNKGKRAMHPAAKKFCNAKEQGRSSWSRCSQGITYLVQAEPSTDNVPSLVYAPSGAVCV